ncbi:MAG TPA: translocation/assembly module TamB domain-containing protein, partial [Azonexus sp.]
RAAGTLLWLGHSRSGLTAVLQLAAAASGGRLHAAGADGRLLGALRIASLRWDDGELQIDAEQVQLDWSPAALLQGRLQIAALSAERLQIVSQPGGPPLPPPTELRLPLAVAIERLAVATLAYGNLFRADDLGAGFASDGRHHRLSDVHAASGDLRLRGEAALDGAAPLPLSLRAEIASELAGRPLAVDLQGSGPLTRLALTATGRQGVDGNAEVLLTPFAPAAFASARLSLRELDPAAWQRGAPHARIDLSAELAPAGDGVGGHFALVNRQPGPIDRQRLPLASLRGQLDWQGADARLGELDARLAGAGSLTGNGLWQDGRLRLELRAARLDAAQLVSTLRPTRLAGPLTATIAANRQDLEIDLRDERFALSAAASRSGADLELPRIELTAGPARLALSGRLALGGEMAFAASGEISRFDPSLFARLPAARINASLAASGTLRPQPRLDGRFVLADSQLAGQPLHGAGRLQLDWPRVPLADIHLAAGANTLQVAGAFGRPGERLSIVVAAPELAPYGLDGSLDGRLDLGGSPARPELQLALHSPRLGRPGLARLHDLKLQGSGSGSPAAPLQLDLAIGRVDGDGRPNLLRQLQLQVAGSRQAHRLQARGELAGRSQFALAADGGLADEADGLRWRGTLREARLSDAEPARNLRLLAPAPLLLAGNAWTFGPARLAGEPLDWRATVFASAERRRLQAGLDADGSRIGRLAARLEAGLHDAWSLDRGADWRGTLDAEIADLGWLGELIGEGWQSAGRLGGQLRLAGTPARPQASGRFQGERLVLRQQLQGLHLAHGELDLELAGQRLRLHQLRFDSLLQAPPRALRAGARDDLAALTRQPGKLELNGELAFDRAAGSERGELEFRLERLGAFQLPEQWLLLSGNGRLGWDGERFAAAGQLAVDAGYWQLGPSGLPRLSDDVVLRHTGATPASRPALDLDFAIDLGRQFLFVGAGLSSRLAGELRLRASGRDLPRASGSVRLRDGRFEAYGQQLTIERGLLTFQGLLDNPALDVLAVRKGLAVEAGVQVGGTAQRPVIRLVSDPELPDAEKLTWLVLGHGPEAVGAGDASVLLSAAGGLLGNNAGKLTGQLKTLFGLDELAVRQGELGTAGSRPGGSRIAGSTVDTTASTGSQILSIGRRLGSNAVLSYEQALGRADSVVKLTVNLNRQVALVGRAGSDNALDIFYTLAFGRPPAPRERGE